MIRTLMIIFVVVIVSGCKHKTQSASYYVPPVQPCPTACPTSPCPPGTVPVPVASPFRP